MKILITGAGLIGCHSAFELAQRGHNATLFDINPNQTYIDAIAGKKRISVLRGDLLDLPALLRAMKTVKPAVVVHSAGFIGSQVANPPLPRHPHQYLRIGQYIRSRPACRRQTRRSCQHLRRLRLGQHQKGAGNRGVSALGDAVLSGDENRQ